MSAIGNEAEIGWSGYNVACSHYVFIQRIIAAREKKAQHDCIAISDPPDSNGSLAMKSKLLRLVALVGIMFVPPLTAAADTVLTYVGKNFDTFSGNYACPSQCNLNISLTLPGLLTNYPAGPRPNTILIQYPATFTYSDGLNVVTDQIIAQTIASGLGNGIEATFYFAIDAAGHIDFSKGWQAGVTFNPLDLPGFGVGPQNYMSSISQGSGGLGTYGTEDQTYEYLPVDDQNPTAGFYLAGLALKTNAPGEWTASYTRTTPPSETLLPASLQLFATGLGVLSLIGWCRKRKATANVI